jgi:AcrR family transcriptional regulator
MADTRKRTRPRDASEAPEGAPRGAEMRRRVIDAAIAVVARDGYAQASTWAICAEARVSRGAMLHHFPTRESLFIAAIGDLADRPLRDLDALLADSRGDMVERYYDWLWHTLDGPMFAVGLELLAAARTEPALRLRIREGADALIARLAKAARQIARTAVDPQALETKLLAAIPMVRGMGLDIVIGGKHAAHKTLFDRWRRSA